MSSIKLRHSSGNSMSITAPATNPASDLSLKLPATIGTAGQVLKNSSTAGTLEFGSPGRILQVVQALKRDTSSSSSTSYVDLPGLSQAITPASTSNKVLVQYAIMSSHNGSGSIPSFLTQIVRDGSAISGALPSDTSVAQYGTTVNYSGSGRMQWVTNTYLDSPSTTSSTTYKIQYRVDGGDAIEINNWNGTDNYLCISHLTLMEVAG